MSDQSVIKVEIQNITRIDKDIYYMRTSAGNMRIHGSRIVADTVNKSKKIFKDAIQQYVYSVPEGSYTRTGNLGKSIKSRNFDKGIGAGEIYMSPGVTGRNGYFYPLAVEYGLRSKPSYWGRHYWAQGKTVAIMEFKKSMKPHADEIVAKLFNK